MSFLDDMLEEVIRKKREMSGLLSDPQFYSDMGTGLRDAGNRGGVAGLIGMPVDAMTGLLNLGIMGSGYAGSKLGAISAANLPQPITEPVGGSEWIGNKMQQAGMVSGNRNPVAEAIASVLGPGAMMKGGRALGAVEGAIAEAAPGPAAGSPAAQAGQVVWHGSPHTFEKFDMSKIGTGEGAQAYGHGMYVAEAKDTADAYKKALSQKDFGALNDVGQEASWWTTAIGKSREQGIEDLVAALGDPNKFRGWNAKDYARKVNALQYLKEGGEIRAPEYKGNTYKVDLPDEHINKMLDWDKPLSQQPEIVDRIGKALDGTKVGNALGVYKGKLPLRMAGDQGQSTGESLYNAIRMAADPAGTNWQAAAPMASDTLRATGIPGIKYRDQGSRNYRILSPSESVSKKWVVGSPDGYDSKFFTDEAAARAYYKEKVTHNYVVFDDSLLKILERQ